MDLWIVLLRQGSFVTCLLNITITAFVLRMKLPQAEWDGGRSNGLTENPTTEAEAVGATQYFRGT